MITIKIKNYQQILQKEKNWLFAKLAPYFLNIQSKVEHAIAEEIQKSFKEKGIEAEIVVTNDLDEAIK